MRAVSRPPDGDRNSLMGMLIKDAERMRGIVEEVAGRWQGLGLEFSEHECVSVDANSPLSDKLEIIENFNRKLEIEMSQVLVSNAQFLEMQKKSELEAKMERQKAYERHKKSTQRQKKIQENQSIARAQLDKSLRTKRPFRTRALRAQR